MTTAVSVPTAALAAALPRRRDATPPDLQQARATCCGRCRTIKNHESYQDCCTVDQGSQQRVRCGPLLELKNHGHSRGRIRSSVWFLVCRGRIREIPAHGIGMIPVVGPVAGSTSALKGQARDTANETARAVHPEGEALTQCVGVALTGEASLRSYSWIPHLACGISSMTAWIPHLPCGIRSMTAWIPHRPCGIPSMTAWILRVFQGRHL